MTALPQNKDVERAVLGAMLIDDEAAYTALEMIDERAFFHPSHGVIFNAISELVENNSPVDQLTITNILRKKDKLDQAGGEAVISALISETMSSANVKHHCGLLLNDKALRELSALSSRINMLTENRENPESIVSNIESELGSILLGMETFAPIVCAGDIVHGVINNLRRVNESNNMLRGIDTGFSQLNEYTGGLQGGQLIILAGKTSNGKTSLALNIAAHISTGITGLPVGIFSLEMSKKLIVESMIQILGKFDLTKVQRYKLKAEDWAKINSGGETIFNNKKVCIHDGGGMSIGSLSLMAKRWKRELGIKMLIVDYTQQVQAKADSREREVALVTRKLKELAMGLDIPIIALSQFSRNANQRTGEPELSDLKESSELEQAADMVFLLYNPHVGDKIKEFGCGDNNRFIIELHIKKNRTGKTGVIPLYWKPDNTRFLTLTPDIIAGKPID